MGRKKIVIEKIKELRRRKVTFVKRKRGILKKAHELAVLTGSAVTLLIHNDNVSEKHAFGESDAVQIEHRTNVNQSMSRDDAELKAWQVDEAPIRGDTHAAASEPGSSSFTEELVPWQPVTLCDEETILAASLPDSNPLSVDTSHWLAMQDFSASSEWIQQFSSQDVLSQFFDDAEWQQYCTRYVGQDMLGSGFVDMDWQHHRIKDLE